ncbi:hypothetical protein LguiB_019748 [Lonicera macranthoides]
MSKRRKESKDAHNKNKSGPPNPSSRLLGRKIPKRQKSKHEPKKSPGKTKDSKLQLTQSTQFQYHNGPLLTNKISINLIWYENFKPSQRAIIFDFVTFISSSRPSQPSVTTWWKTTEKYYHLLHSNKPASSLYLSVGNQILDDKYSLGKSLTNNPTAGIQGPTVQLHQHGFDLIRRGGRWVLFK